MCRERPPESSFVSLRRACVEKQQWFGWSEERSGVCWPVKLVVHKEGGHPWPDFWQVASPQLVERGVRFVQIYHGGDNDDWDTHGDNHNGQAKRMREVDQGCTALLSDLRSRGLLDETLVVWTGEFGRTPTTEGKNGRDHSPYDYSMWLAGGGIKGGCVYGATDELGFRAVEHPVHAHDLNATLLHQLGLHHEQLTWRHEGRDFQLTDDFGIGKRLQNLPALREVGFPANRR